jgi:hypothetical protein
MSANGLPQKGISVVRAMGKAVKHKEHQRSPVGMCSIRPSGGRTASQKRTVAGSRRQGYSAEVAKSQMQLVSEDPPNICPNPFSQNNLLIVKIRI